jgi:diguanylate cyclase (GGDEF)-like protein/PAS domain S-box-containing protein
VKNDKPFSMTQRVASHMRRSLQARLMLVVVMAAALFAAAAGGLAYRIGYDRALDNGRTTLNGLVDAVEKTAAIAAYTTDNVLMQEVLDGVARNAAVSRVEMLAADGARLRSAGAPASANEPASPVTVERSLLSPFDAGERVGTLRIHANMAGLRATARAQANVLAALMVLQALLIAGVLYGLSTRLVSRPIQRLARALSTTQPGTPHRLTVPQRHRDDEIGVLIGGANALLAASEAALQRERALRAEIEAMEAQYRQIFDSTSAGIFVLQRDGRLINGNPTVLKVIGAPVQNIRQLAGDDFIRSVFARPDRVHAMVEQAAERGETVTADLELLQRAGAARWVHCLISVQTAQPDAQADGLIEGVMYDVTERKHAEHAVRHLAEHDSLTGLKNRVASEAALDRFINDAAASGASVSLLYIDLDGFKRVNDQLGHKAGDEVLQQCAQRMLAAVRRSSDLVGRIGGDEFVIALNHTGPDDPSLTNTARQLVDSLRLPVVLDDRRQALIGASVGIACYPHHASSRRALVSLADEAMYEVKRSGRNAYAMALESRPGFADSGVSTV